MKISIVVPAYNEAERLPKTLKELATFLLNYSEDVKLIVVDDGSSDNTADVASGLIIDLNLNGEVISYKENHGKGYAVRTGMKAADKNSDYFYLADSDYSSPWEILPQLIEEAESSAANTVIGSRAMPESDITRETSRLVSGRVSNFLINLFLKLGIEDTQCGYKLFDSESIKAFDRQKLDRWGFDFEILFIIKHKMNLKIKEVGIKWRNIDGSKVRFKDYFRTFSELIKVRTTKYEI